jgi:hypothetical protein
VGNPVVVVVLEADLELADEVDLPGIVVKEGGEIGLGGEEIVVWLVPGFELVFTRLVVIHGVVVVVVGHGS